MSSFTVSYYAKTHPRTGNQQKSSFGRLHVVKVELPISLVSIPEAPETTDGFQQPPSLDEGKSATPLSRQPGEKWHVYIGKRGFRFGDDKVAKLPVCKLGSNVLSL